ncbi:sel1 repeat family protein [Dyella halodurans]|uniref:Tetratricopeptide repeat protein n=1 Tax=Dyella halodurans TaxID=1920171 RepID=A0ABV9BWJ6_9GAMM|nr:sel1 repeat family protein [Dyella halodurans]
MALRKLVTFCTFCLFTGLAVSSALAQTAPDQALPTIPIDAKPSSKAIAFHDPTADQSAGESGAFNTPSSDGKPGEYFFHLGVQAATKQDFVHAMAMYKVAATWGYKPAQYNLGVMYLSGQGTAVDLPQAMAWMALAAERDEAQYVRARQLVYANLTPEQFAKANEIWRQLLPTYGDAVALPRAKARWHEALSSATGSRVGSSAAHVQVGGVAGSANHMNSPNYDVHDGGHISTNPAEVAGVRQTDGAVAFQQLRSTDNPYDPKLTASSGTVNVGELAPVKQKDGEATKDVGTPTDPANQGHP